MAQRGVEDLRELATAWWVLALVALLCIAAGVIVLAEPSISLSTLAVVTGIFVLIDGIFETVWALFDSVENRGLVAVFGVITAIVGVVLIRHPTKAVAVIALLLGLWLLVVGVLRLITVFAVPEHRLWSAFVGVLELIAGIVIVSSPDIGVATLALLVGISLIVRGCGLGVLAWALRAVGHEVSHAAGGATASG